MIMFEWTLTLLPYLATSVLKFHNVGEKVSGHTSTKIMPHFARPLCRWLLNLSFGDELQAQLSHIRASIKIGNTTSTTKTHKRGDNQGGHGLKNSKPFFRASVLSVAQPTEQSCEEHVQQFEHSHKELETISTREIDTSIISKLQSLEVSEYQ